MYYDDEPDCRGCGVRDYGFDMPDVRSTLYVSKCETPAECEEDGCECEQTKIQVRIKRIWDKECGYCGGVDWRPSWEVLEDGKVIATVPSESAADAVVEAEYPSAESDYDPAWESERGLRIAEGWGY
jgi:hypothetical protein